MCMNRRKKKAITLLEIMIVIFLIGLIGSVIGYNVKGSLEEGKAFRSEQGITRIQDILLMEVANGADPEQVVADPEKFLNHSGLSSQSKKLLKDGWGKPYLISVSKNGQDISVKSEALVAYRARKKGKLPKEQQTKAQEQEDFEDEE